MSAEQDGAKLAPSYSVGGPEPRPQFSRKVSFADTPTEMRQRDSNEEHDRSTGVLSNIIELYQLESNYGADNSTFPSRQVSQATSMASGITTSSMDSDDFLEPGEMFAPENKIRANGDDPADLEKDMLRRMDYKQRRKERERIRIEFNITCRDLWCLDSSFL